MAEQSAPSPSLRFEQMTLRLAVLVALILGLGTWWGWFAASAAMVSLHIGVGLLALVMLWSISWKIWRFGKRSSQTWSPFFLALLGASLGLWFKSSGTGSLGVFHFILMLLAVGMAEMLVARLSR